jgi:hypothetical protein
LKGEGSVLDAFGVSKGIPRGLKALDPAKIVDNKSAKYIFNRQRAHYLGQDTSKKVKIVLRSLPGRPKTVKGIKADRSMEIVGAVADKPVENAKRARYASREASRDMQYMNEKPTTKGQKAVRDKASDLYFKKKKIDGDRWNRSVGY